MRVRDAFHENKNLTDATAVKKQVAEGYKNLAIIKRQVWLICKIFTTNYKAVCPCDENKISEMFTNNNEIIFFFIQVIIGDMFEPQRLVIEKQIS